MFTTEARRRSEGSPPCLRASVVSPTTVLTIQPSERTGLHQWLPYAIIPSVVYLDLVARGVFS